MSWRMDTVIAGVTSVLASGTAVVLGFIGGADAAIVLQALVIYGPLGIICAYLLYREREREHEHAAERRESWKAVGSLKVEIEQGNKTLAQIKTILDERKK